MEIGKLIFSLYIITGSYFNYFLKLKFSRIEFIKIK